MGNWYRENHLQTYGMIYYQIIFIMRVMFLFQKAKSLKLLLSVFLNCLHVQAILF